MSLASDQMFEPRPETELKATRCDLCMPLAGSIKPPNFNSGTQEQIPSPDVIHGMRFMSASYVYICPTKLACQDDSRVNFVCRYMYAHPKNYR